MLDEVVDEYLPVVAGLENDIGEIEDQLFGEDDDERLAHRDLSREVIDFQRAVHPLAEMLEALLKGGDRYGVRRAAALAARRARPRAAHRRPGRLVPGAARQRPAGAVDARRMDAMTRTSVEQNEQMKKITSWAAILFAPGAVGAVYGMNFRHMPELDWPLGYPFALALMLGLGVGLYAIFKWRRWL